MRSELFLTEILSGTLDPLTKYFLLFICSPITYKLQRLCWTLLWFMGSLANIGIDFQKWFFVHIFWLKIDVWSEFRVNLVIFWTLAKDLQRTASLIRFYIKTCKGFWGMDCVPNRRGPQGICFTCTKKRWSSITVNDHRHHEDAWKNRGWLSNYST